MPSYIKNAFSWAQLHIGCYLFYTANDRLTTEKCFSALQRFKTSISIFYTFNIRVYFTNARARSHTYSCTFWRNICIHV